MLKKIALIGLLVLAGCAINSVAVTKESYEEVQVGDSLDKLKKDLGRPFDVVNKGGQIQEYEYIERVNMGQQMLYENHYFFVVSDGVIIEKRVYQEKPPAYQTIYTTDPLIN